MTEWRDQVALITGAGSGIGAALARYANAAGMHVIAADIDNEGLQVLFKNAAPAQNPIETVTLDVRNAEAIENLADQIFNSHKQVNLLFNNAGVLVDGKSWERTLADWRWSIDVNLMGVIHAIRSFVPRMLAQGSPGRIINTASIGGLIGGGIYMGPYQSTKHAIVALSETLYCELQEEEAPVTASVLCPGEVATRIWEPDRLRGDESTTLYNSNNEKLVHDFASAMVADGLAPNDFAPLVFEQIQAGHFWLLPQPEFRKLFQHRANSILNQINPPDLKELMALMKS